MTNRVHTLLCWILAISLVWLPLSASADNSLVSTEKNNCHEMDSVLPGQVVVSDNPTNESVQHKGCCDQCEKNCVACTGLSSCAHCQNHASPFILFSQYTFRSLPLMQPSIEQFVQYHSQIITPDIRPPVI